MKIYDLSAAINEELWYYGTPYVPYQSRYLATVEENGYITKEHKLTSHTGTHLECAKHWWDDGQCADKVELEKIVGKAKVLRLSCGEQPFYAITPEMLRATGAGKLERGDICILATGWDKRIREENYTWESPFITVESANYLLERGIKAFAIDAPMFGDPRDGMDIVPADLELPDYIFQKSGIPCILGLVGAWDLPEETFFLAAPLKIEDADGSPVRALAIEF